MGYNVAHWPSTISLYVGFWTLHNKECGKIQALFVVRMFLEAADLFCPARHPSILKIWNFSLHTDEKIYVTTRTQVFSGLLP